MKTYSPYSKLFPNWNELPVETREELVLLLNNRATWAHKKLVQDYGLPCDSDNDGCNPHLAINEPRREYGDE